MPRSVHHPSEPLEMHPRVSIFLQTVKAFWMDRHRTKSTAPEPNLLNLKHEPISLKLRIGDWGSI